MIDDRDKSLKKQNTALKKDITNLKEQYKILQKRLDFTQDEVTKLIVQERALIQAVAYIVEVGKQIAERNKIEQSMGLEPQKQPDSTPIASKSNEAGIG